MPTDSVTEPLVVKTRQQNTDPDMGRNGFDQLPRYVRIKRCIKDQFVEFDFAIGEPHLYVELVLPEPAFALFCQHNRVIHMTDEQANAIDLDMEKWRYGKEQRDS